MLDSQSNETVLEDLQMIAIKENSDDVSESGNNESSPSLNEITQQSSPIEAPKKNTIIYGRKMEKFQTHGSRNTSSIKYVQKNKKVSKVKEKRTANGSYNTLDMSNSTQHELRQYESSNISAINENITVDNNNTFSPRGFNPRSFSRLVKEIVIGISRGGDGEYEEYDADSEFNTNPEEKLKRMVAFEEPYKIHTEDDVQRYTNPDRIVENFLRTSKGTKRIYYIAAEEVQWDYSGRAIRYNMLIIALVHLLSLN